MKSEQGITIIALIVYIIIMTFVVAGVSSITSTLYGNVNEMDKTSEGAVLAAKFNMYMINDIKSKNVQIVSGGTDTNQVQIAFTNKNGKTETVKYSFQNKALYRSSSSEGQETKVKICDNVKDAKMTKDDANNTITVTLLINNYEKTTVYALEPKTV